LNTRQTDKNQPVCKGFPSEYSCRSDRNDGNNLPSSLSLLILKISNARETNNNKITPMYHENCIQILVQTTIATPKLPSKTHPRKPRHYSEYFAKIGKNTSQCDKNILTSI
jgi:hypothetical protein